MTLNVLSSVTSLDGARTQAILRGLGYAPARKPKDGEPIAWRRRSEKAPGSAPVRPHSPFAALAALKDTPPPARRRRRKAASK